MHIQTKQQIWEFFLSNPAYQDAISSVSPQERERIEAFVRDRCVELVHRVSHLAEWADTKRTGAPDATQPLVTEEAPATPPTGDEKWSKET